MMIKLYLSILLLTNVLLLSYSYSYQKFYTKSSKFRLYSDVKTLETGEFEETSFTQIETIASDLGKFDLQCSIGSSDLNNCLDEYKEELKKRKISFPGFRPGKIPPFAMPDIRKYVVCFALENTIGQLCNMNNLRLCNEDRSDVSFGSDEYYSEIIQKDSEDRDFITQRDAWREGNDFTFKAQFFAEFDESDEVASESDDIIETTETESSGSDDEN